MKTILLIVGAAFAAGLGIGMLTAPPTPETKHATLSGSSEGNAFGLPDVSVREDASSNTPAPITGDFETPGTRNVRVEQLIAAADLGRLSGEERPRLKKYAWLDEAFQSGDYTRASNAFIDALKNAKAAEMAYLLDIIERGPYTAYDRNTLQIALVNRWAALDPAGAYGYLQDIPNGNHRRFMLQRLIGAWARTDLDAALKTALDHPGSSLSTRLAREALEGRIADDPERVLDALGRLGAARAFRSVYEQAFAELAKDGTYEALAGRALALNDDVAGAALEGILKGWVAADPFGALDSINRLASDGVRGDLLRDLFDEWSDRDPAQAAANLTSIRDPQTRSRAIGAVMRDWMEKDLEGAVAWSLDIANQGDRQAAIGAIVRQVSNDSPDIAAALVMELPPGNNRRQLIAQIGSRWGGKDPVAVINWATQNLAGDDLFAASNNAMNGIMREDPGLAVGLLDAYPPGAYRDRLLRSAAWRYGRNEPKQAVAWLENLDEPESVTAIAYQSLMAGWSNRDPDGAISHVNTMAKGLARDRATQSTAIHIIGKRPQAAADLAATVERSDLRVNTLRTVFTNWANKDAAGAASHLDKMQLSQDERDALTEIVESKATNRS